MTFRTETLFDRTASNAISAQDWSVDTEMVGGSTAFGERQYIGLFLHSYLDPTSQRAFIVQQ